MSIYLFGTASQDGLILAFTALGVALLSRATSRRRSLTAVELWGAATCLALVGIGKAPYAPLVLILLAAPTERRRTSWAAAAAALGVVVLWWTCMSATVQTPLYEKGLRLVPADQMNWLLGHLEAVPELAFHTLWLYVPLYYAQVLGVLGRMDLPLPATLYGLASPALMLAAVLSAGIGRPDGWKAVRPLALGLALLAAALVFGSLYLTWTPVGAPQVEGVQGRYLSPILIFATLALEGERAWVKPGRWREAAAGVVAAFPIISLIVVAATTISRYY
jgi:uncharacterized membrane protein